MFSSENMVLGVLSDDSFVMVNKKLARALGFVEAGLLGEFISTYRYVKKENQFYKGGSAGPWFFLTQPSVEKNLGIKRASFDTAVKNLVKSGVLVQKRMGLPAKNYYQVDWDKIVEFLAENPPEPAPLTDCGIPAVLTSDSGGHDVAIPAPIINTYKKDSTKINSKNFVNKAAPPAVKNFVTKVDFMNLVNSFYPVFAPGRWSKAQWVTLSEALVSDLLEKSDVQNWPAYVSGCLSSIAYKHDLKNGKIEFPDSGPSVPFYNWLEN